MARIVQKCSIHLLTLLAGVLLFPNPSTAQPFVYTAVDTRPFADAAHHWYDIFEKENIIEPQKNKPQYQPTELVNIADNILLYQKNNGGWPKNYDIMAILTVSQKALLLQAKSKDNTTFDNGTTWTHVECLAKIYTVTKINRFKEACLKGLDFIRLAQYANGGWPQYYPLKNDYSRLITYNDDVIAGIMGVLQQVVDAKPWFDFLKHAQRRRLVTAFNKGLSCILATQIVDNGKPTAWCQQHNEITLQPEWARTFEPPAICNGESVDIVLLLMDIKQPNAPTMDAIEQAVAWFNASKIYNTRQKIIAAPADTSRFTISTTDKIVVTDSAAPPIWTRYYELGTRRPMFCNRGQKIVYSLAEVARERRDGYGWYTYAPQKVLDHYAAWQRAHTTAKAVLQ